MELIPAIDLRGGRVVRLVEGDFARETAYDADPFGAVRRWLGAGARRLHVVDLDGARAGYPMQAGLVGRIVAEATASGVPCQVAGGLRDAEAATGALALGAERIVMGTALLRDPDLTSDLVARFGTARIVGALDVRDGVALGEGWRVGAAGPPVVDALAFLLARGMTTFAVTSIERDGRLEGPDCDLYARLRQAAPAARLIASGGITTLDDLRALHDLGCEAAILGRALYDRRLDLGQAMAAADAWSSSETVAATDHP